MQSAFLNNNNNKPVLSIYYKLYNVYTVYPLLLLKAEAEFLDVIGTKAFGVFLLAIHSHLYQRILLPPSPSLSKSGWKLVCNVNIVHRNYKSETSQDYAQRPQRNCTIKNSASDFAGSSRDAYNKKVKNKFRILFWKALFCQEEQRGQPYGTAHIRAAICRGAAIW